MGVLVVVVVSWGHERLLNACPRYTQLQIVTITTEGLIYGVKRCERHSTPLTL